MFECRNKKEPKCKGIYRSKIYEMIYAFCDNCGHKIFISDLKQEQIDHNIKENKEKSDEAKV